MFCLFVSLCIALLCPWHASANGAANAVAAGSQTVRVAVLGDSLSAAYNIPLEAGWVSLLQKKLEENKLSVEVFNASISGATTAAGLQALPAVLRQKPDIVVLELGGNDGLQGKPVAMISANLSSLIEQSRAAGAAVLLLGMQLPPNLGSRYTRPFFEQYARLAEKYQLQLVPFLLQGVAGNPEMMQEDGIHPVAAAQPQMLANVWPPLLAMIKELAAP